MILCFVDNQVLETFERALGSRTILLHISFRIPSIIGMKKYLRAFDDHIAIQNKKSLSHLKRVLSSFYGTKDFLSQLRDLGSKAFSRSIFNGRKRNKEITSIAEVGNVSGCNRFSLRHPR